MADRVQTPLRSLRVAAGLSLRDVEERTGINRGRLSIIERGVVPTADESARYLAALTVARKDSEDEATARLPE